MKRGYSKKNKNICTRLSDTMEKGYAFSPTVEYIKETMNLSPKEKLTWLEEANEFLRKYVSPRKIKLWEKFRSK